MYIRVPIHGMTLKLQRLDQMSRHWQRWRSISPPSITWSICTRPGRPEVIVEFHRWYHGETLNQLQQLKPYILIRFVCFVWITGPDYNHHNSNNSGGWWAKQTSSFFGLCSQKCHWAASWYQVASPGDLTVTKWNPSQSLALESYISMVGPKPGELCTHRYAWHHGNHSQPGRMPKEVCQNLWLRLGPDYMGMLFVLFVSHHWFANTCVFFKIPSNWTFSSTCQTYRCAHPPLADAPKIPHWSTQQSSSGFHFSLLEAVSSCHLHSFSALAQVWMGGVDSAWRAWCRMKKHVLPYIDIACMYWYTWFKNLFVSHLFIYFFIYLTWENTVQAV